MSSSPAGRFFDAKDVGMDQSHHRMTHRRHVGFETKNQRLAGNVHFAETRAPK